MKAKVVGYQDYQQFPRLLRGKIVKRLIISDMGTLKHCPIRGICDCTGCSTGKTIVGGRFRYPELVVPPGALANLDEFIATGIDGIDLDLVGENVKTIYLNACLAENYERLEIFTHLKRLEISNPMGHLPEINFSNLTSLEALNIETQTKIDLRGCTSLVSARLTRVKISTEEWLPTENLRTLELRGCPHREGDSLPVLNLINHGMLRRLDIRNTRIGRIETGRMDLERNRFQAIMQIEINTDSSFDLIIGDSTDLILMCHEIPLITAHQGGTLVSLDIRGRMTDPLPVREYPLPRGSEEIAGSSSLNLSEHYGLEVLKISNLTNCQAIQGLEFCEKLREIVIDGASQLEHLSHIEWLGELKKVSITSKYQRGSHRAHQVCPINSLFKMPKLPSCLTELKIEGIELHDLVFLEGCSLEKLTLVNCLLESLDGLSCDNLVDAILTDNKLTSVANLLTGDRLEFLDIARNPVSDIECLQGKEIVIKR